MEFYKANDRPNGFGLFGNHTVQVKLQCGNYHGTLIKQTGGNCTGADILKMAASTFEDNEFEPNMSFPENVKHVTKVDDDYAVEYSLFTEDGQELIIDSKDAKDYVVGVAIINWEREKR